ncbi:hypothetical protein L21SP3_01776 [Sedimentisphaera cyanobacteriorum]|uniref:Bacterial Pleckstrin homology domain-containing protein n=1 Tax=Sedimentisphaera cyanobacteriorum TaxID=1940790 RepID=A0A1Q2HRU4_9BACT|nr:PH domain-containing protein [Sedimentisphaera cyanobacteriorum]AQQ09955.1 hypothetical protein L21SP3_01776 [Sedimentisphaera cyanobacteriorum]
MESSASFNAPWSKSLKFMTGVFAVILAGIALIGIFTASETALEGAVSMTAIPLAILLISALFTIRGYVLTKNTLIIRRLVWNTRLDLTGLISAEAKPKAMSKSIRTFGNGGLFCFAGAFHNKALGSYRAFVTDTSRTVVLKFANRTVVVSPDKPEEFVTQIKNFRKI